VAQADEVAAGLDHVASSIWNLFQPSKSTPVFVPAQTSQK
jgi:hypothetical protein